MVESWQIRIVLVVGYYLHYTEFYHVHHSEYFVLELMHKHQNNDTSHLFYTLPCINSSRFIIYIAQYAQTQPLLICSSLVQKICIPKIFQI